MTKALLRCLERHALLDHLCRAPVTEQTPGNVRHAEFACDGLNLLAHNLLVADRACLTAMREHPVVITCLHRLFQLKQALHIPRRKLNRTIRAVILRRVKLAAIYGTTNPQLTLLHVEV